MNEIIFENQLKGLLKEFQGKIVASKMEEIIYKVTGQMISTKGYK